MKEKLLYVFILPTLLLIGNIFVYNLTTASSGLFYRSSSTGTFFQIEEDGTETVISTTTQTSISEEVASFFDLQLEIAETIYENFPVQSVIALIINQTETKVFVNIFAEDKTSLCTEEIESVVKGFMEDFENPIISVEIRDKRVDSYE